MTEPTFEELDSLGFDLWSRARPSNTRDLWGALDEGERSYWRSVARLAWPLRAQNAELVTALRGMLIVHEASGYPVGLSDGVLTALNRRVVAARDAIAAAAGHKEGGGK